jgi:hypothetical protein
MLFARAAGDGVGQFIEQDVRFDRWSGEKLDRFTGGSGCGLKDLWGRLERRPATRFAGSV